VTFIFVILIVFILGLTLIPFKLSLKFSKQFSKFEGDFTLSWMKIKLFQQNIPVKEKKKRKKEKKDEKKPFDRQKIGKIIALFYESLPELLKILKTILKSLSLEELNLNFIIGFDSPVDTAVTSGYIWSLAAAVNIFPNIYLNVIPDFQKERLDGHIRLILKLRIIWILIAFFRAIIKRPVRNLFLEIRR
jgi:Protein of unknown function (DUF2953)